MKTSPKFSPEFRARAIRLVQEHCGEYPSLWAAVESIASKIRCNRSTLLKWVKPDDVDQGKRVGVSTADRDHLKALERECEALRPLDQVSRQFKADRPNPLRLSDFIYVSTWQGWLYLAFVVDVFALRVVGWRVSRPVTPDFVLDALEQALYARRPERHSNGVHHSDQGSAVQQHPLPQAAG